MTVLFRALRFSLCALTICWAAAILTSCGTTGSPAARVEGGKAAPKFSTDMLRVGDLLNIDFSGTTDPPTSKHEERIKDDGKIDLPFIGEIQAAGRTRGQLQEDILAAYVPQYYRHLTVVIRSENRFFYVEGMVKSAGRYPHLGEMTLLRCIAAAGDFNDFAKKTKVQVTRSNGQKLMVNCVEAQRHPEKDIPIYPDDHIFVPRRYF